MNLFNSVILLFVVHPFDVGDALLITTNTTGTGAADYCIVEELSLVVSHLTPLAVHILLSLHICLTVLPGSLALYGSLCVCIFVFF